MPIPTIAEAATLIAARRISPVELTRQCLERAARLEPLLHTSLAPMPDRAMADASAAEARMMAGTPRGPLDGIPIAHMDGSTRAPPVPAAETAVARMLADAGTVLTGRVAPRAMVFNGSGDDAPGPAALNPWNAAHGAGGAGGGIAAAVAAGLILGGTGTDTCGALRGAAALCGIVGLKPTQGLVPRGGFPPLSHSLDHAGPMAWTVEDCALLLQTIAGRDPADAAARSAPNYRAALAGRIAGLRIGLVRHFHDADAPVSAATRQGIADAIAVFGALGAHIVDVSLPALKNYQACGMVLLLAEAAGKPPDAWRGADGASLADQLGLGRVIGAGDYARAQRFRQDLTARTLAAMAGVDVLLTATQPEEAARVTQESVSGLYAPPSFLLPGNVTGLPALSLCGGFGAGGLPVAIQLLGKPFQESILLRAGHAFETATPWRNRRPDLSAPALAA